jgi:hypothetical protein
MKRILIIALVAVAATVTLCSATSAFSDNASNGTVQFESTSMPSLNFTMPVSRAGDIYRLMPESVTAICVNEYEAVRSKSLQSSSFTHEGVKIRKTGDDSSMTFVFSVPGYKVTVSEVSWEDLDLLFIKTAGNK